MTNLELSNELAHDAKLVLSFITGPKRFIKITCTYCNKLYIDKTGRRPGDRFREHLCDVERN